jgi:hypothetical protein
MVKLQIYTYCWPFRITMPSEASTALSILKTTYRETTSFILTQFYQIKFRCYHPMEQKLSWETNSCSASHKIPHIYKKNSNSLLHSQCSKSIPVPSQPSPLFFLTLGYVSLFRSPKLMEPSISPVFQFLLYLWQIIQHRPLILVFYFLYVTSKLLLALLHFPYNIGFSNFFLLSSLYVAVFTRHTQVMAGGIPSAGLPVLPRPSSFA